ncbi:hypothetical protein D3C87_630950 [compost metagenome]
MAQRIQAVLVLAGMDDRVVVVRRGIQVVVVVVQPRLAQRHRLLATEHAQRGAGFQAQRLHLADHRRHLGDVAFLGRAPGRAHAEPRCAGRLGLPRLGHHVLGGHQLLRVHPGAVALGLRAICAVFGAAAGLDRQQRGHLHLRRIEVLAVHAGGAMQQHRQRQREQGQQLLAAPVVADVAWHGTALGVQERGRKCGRRPKLLSTTRN